MSTASASGSFPSAVGEACGASRRPRIRWPATGWFPACPISTTAQRWGASTALLIASGAETFFTTSGIVTSPAQAPSAPPACPWTAPRFEDGTKRAGRAWRASRNSESDRASLAACLARLAHVGDQLVSVRSGQGRVLASSPQTKHRTSRLRTGALFPRISSSRDRQNRQASRVQDRGTRRLPRAARLVPGSTSCRRQSSPLFEIVSLTPCPFTDVP